MLKVDTIFQRIASDCTTVTLELAQNTVVSGNEDGISSRTFYWLDVYDNDGTYIKWQIRNCFGDTASLYKTIVGAYNHYRREGQFIV
jgi:hypothetical protein